MNDIHIITCDEWYFLPCTWADTNTIIKADYILNDKPIGEGMCQTEIGFVCLVESWDENTKPTKFKFTWSIGNITLLEE